MGMPETKSEVLWYIEKATRNLNPESTDVFTTNRIAGQCHISRNLASQYLNELVRDRLVVKINSRPVLYLHRRGLERYLQASIKYMEYSSMQALLEESGVPERHDFEKAIGRDLSLSVCIEQLRSAISYPPSGLPALLVGTHGTGKAFLARLTYEYGINSGILPRSAHFVVVDCSRYDDNDSAIMADIFGTSERTGAVQQAAGGVVYIERVDHLSQAVNEQLLGYMTEDRIVVQSKVGSVPPTRFILGSSRSLSNKILSAISHLVPVIVSLPSYAERGECERMALVMHYLRIEGQRIAADIAISRGALRALTAANFDENINGLRTTVTSCCAEAYLNRDADNLVIHVYNLPTNILTANTSLPDDDQLVSDNNLASLDPAEQSMQFFQQMVDSYDDFKAGTITFDELTIACIEELHASQDLRNFDDVIVNPRIASYERILTPVIEQVNEEYGIELSRKVTRLLSQALVMQLWGGDLLTLWRRKYHDELCDLASIFTRDSQIATVVIAQISARVRTILGTELDELTKVMLEIEVIEAIGTNPTKRDSLGVVICHGYATATSIADAANRILHKRVFEAIDMTYDQEIKDIITPLSRLLERFSFCDRVVILVDMGSLEQVSAAITRDFRGSMYVFNNVSTSLALGVGNALSSDRDFQEFLDQSLELCWPTYHVICSSEKDDVIAFCSEAGSRAADNIRKLVQDSLPEELPVNLITCDYDELVRSGDQAAVFNAHRVHALVGTMNPGILQVPFIPLEDILYSGSSEDLDRVLSKVLSSKEMDDFHSRLLRNLTLRSAAESITILNPEMLYLEADHAMRELSRLSGIMIDDRRRIAVYVHLCGLIERLVTKSFVNTYPDEKSFEQKNHEFIDWFYTAFHDMCRRYKVEIPVSEIAYVHHMLTLDTLEHGDVTCELEVTLEDE